MRKERKREMVSDASSGQGNSAAENEPPLPSQPAEPTQQKEKQEFVKMQRTRHTAAQSNYR